MRHVVGSILIIKYRSWCTLTFQKCVKKGKLCQNATLIIRFIMLQYLFLMCLVNKNPKPLSTLRGKTDFPSLHYISHSKWRLEFVLIVAWVTISKLLLLPCVDIFASNRHTYKRTYTHVYAHTHAHTRTRRIFQS